MGNGNKKILNSTFNDNNNNKQEIQKSEIFIHFENYLNSFIDSILISKNNFTNNNQISIEEENKILNELQLEKEKLDKKRKEYYFNITLSNSLEDHYITIFKNCRQLSGNLCGFHAIFNIKNFLNFYKINNFNCNLNNQEDLSNSKNLYYLKKIRNRGK